MKVINLWEKRAAMDPFSLAPVKPRHLPERYSWIQN